MRILVVGAGGREHALSWALARSDGVTEVSVCPGNGGTAWPESDGVAACRRVSGEPAQIAPDYDLVVVGPEAPLVEGLADELIGVPVFGPSRKAARIEASKDYAKAIMQRKGVPTARHQVITSADELTTFGTPVVVKDDGLAAGKGVGVFEDLEPARKFFLDLSSRCERIFVEEYLPGPELSVLAFCDGRTFSLMPPARDYKRRFENDQGPNTGGMGAISPVEDLPEGLLEDIGRTVIAPVLSGLSEDGAPFVGVLYVGLKLTPKGPKVLEFNCRFGDPETQVILPQFEGNLAKLMISCAEGRLDESQVKWSGQAHTAVVMASEGYPGAYAKGYRIDGLESENGLIFQAGTACLNGGVVTEGGRVLALVGRGSDLDASTRAAYELLKSVSFQGAVYRKDIGS